MGPNQTYKILHSKKKPEKKKKTWEKKSTAWEKIFANDVTDKGLTSKLYKQLIWLNDNNKKTNQEMSRRLQWTFRQRRQTAGQKAYEKMLYITNY